MTDPPESVFTRTQLVCVECSRLWLHGDERWRLKISSDDPPETVPYCPECARREFGLYSNSEIEM
jgi:hypothetical protein